MYLKVYTSFSRFINKETMAIVIEGKYYTRWGAVECLTAILMDAN